MQRTSSVLIEQDEDGVFVAQLPDLPGCVSQGATRAAANWNIQGRMCKECDQALLVEGLLIGIPLLDRVVVAERGYVSLREA